jgi:hypothetical protein
VKLRIMQYTKPDPLPLIRALKIFSMVLGLGVGIGAWAALPSIGGTSWKEEVLLHDGSKIVVTRWVNRSGRHEIGQKPPYKEQSLSFSMPNSGRSVKWQDHYSEDLGTANFLPMLLDIKDGAAYLVASPMGCLSYNKWGRPNPPYIVFKYEGKDWQRIPLADLPGEIKATNLIFSMPDIEVERIGKSFVSAEVIRGIVAKYKQPEYRSIVREKIENAGGRGCGEMIGNGKGSWIGIGWFRRKPSLEACLQYCTKEDFSVDYCPCNTLFKGK